jgi:hypothetical protein
LNLALKLCDEPMDAPASFATSRTVIRRFSWITYFTWTTRCSVLEVDG